MQAKGTVSDAFKRAASLKWGVARNVYLLPSLWAVCKVSSSGGKDRALPDPASREDLLEQLTSLGWEHDGTLIVSGDDG